MEGGAFMTVSRRDFVKLAAGASASLAAPAIWTSARAQNSAIRIGCTVSQTGTLAGTKASLIGFEIWRDDVNAGGGLLGRKVELAVYDDQSSPAQVPGLYSKLIDIDKADFLFSPYGANLTATMMPLTKQRDRLVVGIHTLAANDSLKHDKFFQAAPWGPEAPKNWARGFFDLAKANGVKKMAIVAADTEFSKTAAAGGKVASEGMGMEVVTYEIYPPTLNDLSPILRNLRAKEPDAVFLCSYPPDSIAMVRGLSEIGVGSSVKLFGGGMVGPQYASLLQALGQGLNGIVNFHLYVPEPTLKFPGIEAFLERYEKIAVERNADPLGFYIPPFCYAAGQIIAAGVKGAGTVDEAAVSKWLHAHPVETIVGTIRFNEIGDWTERRVLMAQFQGIKGNDIKQFRQPGKQVVLDPPLMKSGDFVPFAQARS
jgi:branched-chain amino acid transport system substrate-binding protein